MFFGLTNSPATFQAHMNSIFSDLIAKEKVTVYLDDILVTKRLSEGSEITEAEAGVAAVEEIRQRQDWSQRRS